MKRLFFTFCVLFAFSAVSAQSKIGVTIYQNTDRFDVRYRNQQGAIEETDNRLNFHRFSVALSFNLGKKYTHELELFIPEFSKDHDKLLFPLDMTIAKKSAYHEEANAYSFRYEVYRRLTKEKPIAFALGAAVNPHYRTIERIPSAPNWYPSNGKMFVASVNIVPRLQWTISKSLLLNLSIPFKVYDYIYSQQKVENPSIPVSQQKSGGSNHEFFREAYTVRLGLMWRIE